MSTMASKRDAYTPTRSVKDLLGAWEKRSSVAFANDSSTAKGPGNQKSTKQHLEDLAVFASPRVIKKKLSAPSIKQIPAANSPETPRPKVAPNTQEITLSNDEPASSKMPQTETAMNKPTQAPPVSDIREKMKAFERNLDGNLGPPWMAQMQRGKRGSVLDRFTPSLSSTNYRREATENMERVTEVVEESGGVTDGASNLSTSSDHEADEGGNDISQSQKINRDALVLDEIQKMIRDVEEQEIDDEMDEEVKSCLIKAALQSPAYKRRWYDVMTDSWIHCPSLATLIMDFSVIELAEELYEEELPMLYSVSIRAVAAEILKDEVELPEYVYRLAAEDM